MKAKSTDQAGHISATVSAADDEETRKSVGGLSTGGENLVVLEAAGDDGTVVNTCGTLFFTSIEAYDLLETQNDRGLLGYDRQDLYLSVGLQTAYGRENEKSTRVEEGHDGAVKWHDEIISIKWNDGGDGVIAEIWNEIPGNDVMIGEAKITKRHVRALALLKDHYARVRLPLSRPRPGGQLELRGILVARLRLVLDSATPRNTATLGPAHALATTSEQGAKIDGKGESESVQGEATAGHLLCSGLTAYDLPPAEGLKFGGSQYPYVKITLGDTSKRSSSVAGGKTLLAWTSQSLGWKVDRIHGGSTLDHGLLVEVWNENESHDDALIGKGLVRPETLRRLQQNPGNRGTSCRVKLSHQAKGRKSTVSMILTFVPDCPEVVNTTQESKNPQDADCHEVEESSNVVVITNLVSSDLSDIMAFSYCATEKVEPYLVARLGVSERTTPTAAVVRGTSSWSDTCLVLPLADQHVVDSSILLLELWTSNPVQDDQVGYVEVDLAMLLIDQRESKSTTNPFTESGSHAQIELQWCLLDPNGDEYGEIRPGVVSCDIQRLRRTDFYKLKGTPGVSEEVRIQESTTNKGGITLPTIGPNEGPGVLKVTVHDIILCEEVEAPEVRVTTMPGKRFATTRPLLEIGGDPSRREEFKPSVTGVWNQELDIPCYSMTFDGYRGSGVTLHADVVVAGVLAGQRLLGKGSVDITKAVQTHKQRVISLEIASSDRGGTQHVVGRLNMSFRFIGAWESSQKRASDQGQVSSVQSVRPLLSPGILRVFIVEARELSGLKREQDPYVVVERKPADPRIISQSKPFSSLVATVRKGKVARWLESCDLRVGQAEAGFLRKQRGDGSTTIIVTLTDKDVRGGDDSLSALEVVVTPESLAKRESSVLWHRLFSQGRDRGFLRIGCCWISGDLEPVSTCCLRPEERVEPGTLYLWLKEGRELVNPIPAAQRGRALPPTCEIELRPYAKVGRKKARNVLGCARVPESENPDRDSGVFHKFLKMTFVEVSPSKDRYLADALPAFLVSVYTKVDGKKVVSGTAEVLLASLCGYKNLSGEAVLRRHRHSAEDFDCTGSRQNGKIIAGRTHLGVFHGRRSDRALTPDDAEALSCPVAAVEKAIPLLHDRASTVEGMKDGAACNRSCGRGGQLRIRALYVPDRLADALGVRSAIKALSKAAEEAMQRFTENPRSALPRSQDFLGGGGSESQILDCEETALPGALDVYLMRATDLELADASVGPIAQLRLLCSAGAEINTSEMGCCTQSGVEWNHQFSMLVDDANLEMLELVILDIYDRRGYRRPVACCKIPLRRYAQNYHASRMVDIGQVAPERFKLSDHRGRGFRGYAIISINFLPEAMGQTHILREAFAPSNNLSVNVGSGPPAERNSLATEQSTICVLIVCMDGGNVHREDRVRVRVSVAENSDDWAMGAPSAGSASAGAISGVGVVDEEAAVCRWYPPTHEVYIQTEMIPYLVSPSWFQPPHIPYDSQEHPKRLVETSVYLSQTTMEFISVALVSSPKIMKVGTEDTSPSTTSGEVLMLSWDPYLPLSAWDRGRASVLRFDISRGTGHPAEWTGFVPTAGLLHSPGSVFERSIHLTGRVGSEPPMSARTVASTGTADGRCGVSLEVAMVFQPNVSSDSATERGGIKIGTHGRAHPITMADMLRTTTSAVRAVPFSSAESPFHPDARRIPCEAGELVVHCLRGRNLQLPRLDDCEKIDAHPEVSLTAVPDGGEVSTSTPYMEPCGRHPVWGQTCTLSITDAFTARVIVHVRNANQLAGDIIIGEIELSVAGIIAAEHGMAAAALLGAPDRLQHHQEEAPRGEDTDGRVGSTLPNPKRRSGREHHLPPATRRSCTEEPARNKELENTRRVRLENINPRGFEAWFPLFVSSRQGGSRERELVGEIRLSFRFLSSDLMQQRELTVGADKGANGPMGSLRYQFERRPGRFFFTIRCCRNLPKAMIGERAPAVEARLRHGAWRCSTGRQVGLNPTFNENNIAEVMWTPQDLNSPELILEVKDKALGGGLIATVRIAVAPFILHPLMPADMWCPLVWDGTMRRANAGIYCSFIYVPFAGEKHQQGNFPSAKLKTNSPTMNSIECIADPEYAGVSRRAWSGMVHVQVVSARGLPASSKDPQVGVRLRVGGHLGGPSPPFQRTKVVRRGRGEPQFNSAFLLGLRREALEGLEDHAQSVVLGLTPVLEVEARCSRGKGKLLGTVEIPIFPLWFVGHMTRAWYPMRSSDGESEAGRVFLGLQFVADAGSTCNSTLAVASSTSGLGGAAGRRRYLFVEVQQGRDLRFAEALSGKLVVNLEMLGSGSRGKSPPSKNGGSHPEWRHGAGLLALPYPHSGGEKDIPSYSNEVLRISVINEVGGGKDRQEYHKMSRGDNAGSPVVGQCDWPLRAADLALGHPISSWQDLWMKGMPAGAVYLRCRLGLEGEGLECTPSNELENSSSEVSSTAYHIAFGNYHVEFMKVQGFERTLRRRGLVAEGALTGATPQGSELPWDGAAYLTEAPGGGGDDNTTYGAVSAPVASGRAVAVSTIEFGSSRSLCVQISVAGGHLIDNSEKSERRTIKAISCVPPEKLVPIMAVPGSQLLEWFPSVEIQDEVTSHRAGAGEADTGQILLSIRYAPLAVGVLEVGVCEAQLMDNNKSKISGSGNLKALTRILPARTGGRKGYMVQSTPGRRGQRTNPSQDRRSKDPIRSGTNVSWEDVIPHRMRFNNAFNTQPATLHVSVGQGNKIIGFAIVGVEAAVHNIISMMAREIADGDRKSRGSAHTFGPVGICEDDFGDPVEAWYPLHSPETPSSLKVANGEALSTEEREPSLFATKGGTQVGQVRIRIKFAPHPKILIRNWQRGDEVKRANCIAAMKALFYRLNRNGSLVVETEDLRRAFVDAVDSFLSKTTAPSHADNLDVCDSTRASQAGEFVLLASQKMKPNLVVGRGATVSESAADSVLAIVDRDRNAEVTFSEYCMFLSQVAAWQTKAGVGDLMSELAEDGSNSCGDRDGEDGSLNRNPDDSWDETSGTRHTYPGESYARPDSNTIVMMQSPRQLPAPMGSGTNSLLGQKVDTTRTAENYDGTNTARNSDFKVQRVARYPTAHTLQRKSVRAQMIHHENSPKPGNPGRNATIRAGADGPGRIIAAHQDAIPTRERRLPEIMTAWTPSQVQEWLVEDIQLPKYARIFREASVDGLVLSDLTDDLLREGLGIRDPLHRLKVLSHVKRIRAQQGQHQNRRKNEESPEPQAATVGSACEADFPICRSIGVDIPEANGQPLATLHDEHKDSEKTKNGTLDRGASTVYLREMDIGEMTPRTRPGSAHSSNTHNSLAPRSAFTANQEAFVQTMHEVRGEMFGDERLGKSAPTARPASKKRKHRLPANATTPEVQEVVRTAMWEAAASLAESNPTHYIQNSQCSRDEDEYPSAWWGSSEGGGRSSMSTSTGHDDIGQGQSSDIDIETGGPETLEHARLLFNQFCLFQRDTCKSPLKSSGMKLSRHRLELCIRSLLQIEMRWDQWQSFLDSIASLRPKGYLDSDEFAKEFAFSSLLPCPSVSRSLPSPRNHPDTFCEFTERETGSVGSNGMVEEIEPGWGTMTRTDVAQLRKFVLRIADTLRASRSTLRGVISTFDQCSGKKVSVSEFMSLVKILTGKTASSSNARATIHGFGRNQAYTLLRCLDKDGDRRVALRDVVGFVFVVWTDELNRLAGGQGEAINVRRRRRQLQRDLRRHFPASFCRAMDLDEVYLSTVRVGPFSALLARVGLTCSSPPSSRLQSKIASPARHHRLHRMNRGRSSSQSQLGFEAGQASTSRIDWVEKDVQGVQRRRGRHDRALSVLRPARRSLEGRPSTSGELGRPTLTMTANRTELKRSNSSGEERTWSLPPRVDLSSGVLAASLNDDVLLQAAFQVPGERRAANKGGNRG